MTTWETMDHARRESLAAWSEYERLVREVGHGDEARTQLRVALAADETRASASLDWRLTEGLPNLAA